MVVSRNQLFGFPPKEAAKDENNQDEAVHANKRTRITRESFDENVLIRVGSEKTVFRFHKKIICDVAPYFKAAFTNGFKESAEQCLDLPVEDVLAFKYFQLWAYTGKILELHETSKDISWATLIDIYLFGETRGIPELQNSIMDILIEKHSIEYTVPTAEVQHIYENTSADSQLRKILVDLFVQKLGLTSPADLFTEEMREISPKDFLVDTIVAQNKRLDSYSKFRTIDSRTSCSKYHVEVSPKTGSKMAVLEEKSVNYESSASSPSSY